MKSMWTAALVIAAAAAFAPRTAAQEPAAVGGCSSCAYGSHAAYQHHARAHCGAGGCGTGGCAAGNCGGSGWSGGVFGKLGTLGHKGGCGGGSDCGAGGCAGCGAGGCGGCGDCGWDFGSCLWGRCRRHCGCKPLGDTCCPGKDGVLVRMYCCLTRPMPNTAPSLKKPQYPLGFPHSPYIRSPRDYFMQDVYQPNY